VAKIVTAKIAPGRVRHVRHAPFLDLARRMQQMEARRGPDADASRREQCRHERSDRGHDVHATTRRLRDRALDRDEQDEHDAESERAMEVRPHDDERRDRVQRAQAAVPSRAQKHAECREADEAEELGALRPDEPGEPDGRQRRDQRGERPRGPLAQRCVHDEPDEQGDGDRAHRDERKEWRANPSRGDHSRGHVAPHHCVCG